MWDLNTPAAEDAPRLDPGSLRPSIEHGTVPASHQEASTTLAPADSLAQAQAQSQPAHGVHQSAGLGVGAGAVGPATGGGVSSPDLGDIVLDLNAEATSYESIAPASSGSALEAGLPGQPLGKTDETDERSAQAQLRGSSWGGPATQPHEGTAQHSAAAIGLLDLNEAPASEQRGPLPPSAEPAGPAQQPTAADLQGRLQDAAGAAAQSRGGTDAAASAGSGGQWRADPGIHAPQEPGQPGARGSPSAALRHAISSALEAGSLQPRPPQAGQHQLPRASHSATQRQQYQQLQQQLIMPRELRGSFVSKSFRTLGTELWSKGVMLGMDRLMSAGSSDVSRSRTSQTPESSSPSVKPAMSQSSLGRRNSAGFSGSVVPYTAGEHWESGAMDFEQDQLGRAPAAVDQGQAESLSGQQRSSRTDLESLARHSQGAQGLMQHASASLLQQPGARSQIAMVLAQLACEGSALQAASLLGLQGPVPGSSASAGLSLGGHSPIQQTPAQAGLAWQGSIPTAAPPQDVRSGARERGEEALPPHSVPLFGATLSATVQSPSASGTLGERPSTASASPAEASGPGALASPSLSNRLAAALSVIMKDKEGPQASLTSGSRALVPGGGRHWQGRGPKALKLELVDEQDRGLKRQCVSSLAGRFGGSPTGAASKSPALADPRHARGALRGGSMAPWDARVPGSPLVSPGMQLVPAEGAARATQMAMKKRLLAAAHALLHCKKKLYQDLVEQLKPFARPRGKALERIVYASLKALQLRAEGRALIYINSASSRTNQEVENALIWYFTALPICPFLTLACTGLTLPVLRGRRNIHIVSMGDLIMTQWPVIMRLLAQDTGSMLVDEDHTNGSSSPAGPLRRVRLTQINIWTLFAPLRRDMESSLTRTGMAAVLSEMAASLGIEFSYEQLILRDDNLRILDSIEHRPDEALAICACSDMAYVSDNPSVAAGARQRLMACFRRLEPDVFTLAEQDITDSCNGSFLSRFDSVFDVVWTAFDSHDACAQPDRRKHLYIMEQQVLTLQLVSDFGCEGAERHHNSYSRKQWKRVIESFGFIPRPVDQSAVQIVNEMLTSYPEGYGTLQDDESLCLTWHEMPFLFASSWTVPR